MSLFQCEKCGCRENTALSEGYWEDVHNGKPGVCSKCKTGEWHGEFPRIMLPKGKFFTNAKGNLEHKETGDTDYKKYNVNGDNS